MVERCGKKRELTSSPCWETHRSQERSLVISPSEDGMMTESSSYHAGWTYRDIDE